MSLYDDRNDFPFRKVHKSRAFSDDSSLQNYYVYTFAKRREEKFFLAEKLTNHSCSATFLALF